MESLLLKVMARRLFSVMGVFSLFVLLRGHHDPGGGFVGGLVAAATCALWTLAQGTSDAEFWMPVPPEWIVGLGLACATSAALLPALLGKPFFETLWGSLPLPGGGHHTLGTTLLFDLGVYAVVLGAVSLFVVRLRSRPSELTDEEEP